MRVLVNYDASEKKHLPIIASMLKQRGIHAIASDKVYGIGDLLEIAKKDNVSANAIILANEATLANLVTVPTKKHATLSCFRGSRLNFSIPTYVVNPLDHITKVKYGKFLLDSDLNKLSSVGSKPLQLAFTVCETKQHLREARDVLSTCLLNSIDIETDRHQRITCISFTGLLGADTTVTYVIPFVDFGIDHWQTEDMYGSAIKAMQDICHNDVPKMMFNNTYDTQYLIRYHAYPNNLIIDVMGMQHAQYAELPKTLDFTASLHCYDYYYWKGESDLARKNKDIRAYWGYCAKDSWYTLRSFLNMCKDYPQYAVKNYQMLYKLTFPCLYCAYEGIAVVESERLKIRKAAQEELDKRLANLRVITCNPKFNPGSWQQVGAFIYDVLGAKKVKDKSTDEKVLKRVAEQHPILARVIDDILVYREEQKAIGTYFDFDQLNGRLLYGLGPFGTDTARFNSKGSNFWVGTQIQNIPDYAKGMLAADAGYTLFEADNNKSEARAVAEGSDCPGLRAALADIERDFYKILGTIFFGIPYEQVTKELRNKVLKRIIHGTNYMMGVDTFIQNVGVRQILEGAALLGMKVNDIKKFVAYLLNIYHEKFPEVRQGYNDIKREILRTKKLVSPMGYTRHFFGNIIEDHKVLRTAVAHKPQNLSVTILNKGFWRVYKLVLTSKGELRLKAQIHDSIFGQFKDGTEEKYRPLILQCMDNPVRMPTGRDLIIPVDFASGFTWKQVKGG